MKQSKTNKEALAVVEALESKYPEALCSLHYEGEGWKLLLMGALSAQCTDERVNTVCKELFSRYPTVAKLAEAPIEDLERILYPCGLYRHKAKNVKEGCALLHTAYGDTVPNTMEELLTFPGVGRKVANLVLGDIYQKGGIVTDTHCIRIAGRLGFYPETEKNPLKVEKVLTPLIPKEEQSDFCHRLVLFGRDVCSAREPKCSTCPLQELCLHFQNKEVEK